MYTNRSAIPGLAQGSSSDWYWSSTEFINNGAWAQLLLEDGNQYNSLKDFHWLVRCVRRF